MVDGNAWQGRGANVMDTRSCSVCMWNQPDPDEVKRRIDYAVSLGSNFVRLCMEAYANPPAAGAIQYKDAVNDTAYLDDIQSIVDYVGTKYNGDVKVLLSMWIDPSLTSDGLPGPQSASTWETIVARFLDTGHVMFGICNEPQNNFNGANDPAVHDAMQRVINSIRYVEDQQDKPHHIVLAQGTGGWARNVGSYVSSPLQDDNVGYEIHIYDNPTDYDNLLFQYTDKLPLIVGEFGPASGYMTLDECQSFGEKCNQQGISWTAWTLHHKCPPNLLVDNAGGGCGSGMVLTLTDWGNVFKALLVQ